LHAEVFQLVAEELFFVGGLAAFVSGETLFQFVVNSLCARHVLYGGGFDGVVESNNFFCAIDEIFFNFCNL
jgi:hypothetical protein